MRQTHGRQGDDSSWDSSFSVPHGIHTERARERMHDSGNTRKTILISGSIMHTKKNTGSRKSSISNTTERRVGLGGDER